MKLRRTLARIISCATPVAMLIIILTMQADLARRNREAAASDAFAAHAENDLFHEAGAVRGDPRFDALAVGIKTGPEVAATRIPIQLLTFIHRVRNFVLIGSEHDFRIGAHLTVYDVVSDARRIEQKNSKDGEAIRKAALDRNILSTARQPSIGDITTSLVPDWDSPGWKNDAKKNIPGFRKLYESYPHADWYMMIDDDTFVFLDNLMDFLDSMNPSTPIYAGRANAFVGCDGVQKHGEGPPFAHGGSGIILSRKAMELLMSSYETCIQKYSSCWAGDIRVGLCMRDLKVNLTTNSGFNGGPPDSFLHWPVDPCAKPFTFHHLRPAKMQDLLNLESAAESRLNTSDNSTGGITFARVYHTQPEAVGNATEWEIDTNRPGADWKTIIGADARYCQDQCRAEAECRAFSWVPKMKDKDLERGLNENANTAPSKDAAGNTLGQCWLKRSTRGREYLAGAVSGVFPERYACNSK
ncbi:hypothetical protein HDU82_007795 [Entophlyctis luteolus]|nr:hypothetical protein HDU82_007795 [Entophlyctis luteolus]